MNTKFLILSLLLIFSSQNQTFLNQQNNQNTNVVNTPYGSNFKESNKILYIFSKDTLDKSNLTDQQLSSSTITRTTTDLVGPSYTGYPDFIKKFIPKFSKVGKQSTFGHWPIYQVSQGEDLAASEQGKIIDGGYIFAIDQFGKITFFSNQVTKLSTNAQTQAPILKESGQKFFGYNYVTDNKGLPLYVSTSDRLLTSNCDQTCLKSYKLYENPKGAQYFDSNGYKVTNAPTIYYGNGIESGLISVIKLQMEIQIHMFGVIMGFLFIVIQMIPSQQKFQNHKQKAQMEENGI